jgi:hypothetical protein
VLRGDLKANSRGLNNSVQALVKNARRHDLVSIALSRVSRLRKSLKPTKPRKPKTRRVAFVQRRKIVKDALRKQKSADIKAFYKNKEGTKPKRKTPPKKAAKKAKVVKPKAAAKPKAEEKK